MILFKAYSFLVFGIWHFQIHQLNFWQEKITRVDNALESIVHSLARQLGESKLALHLLLELSKSSAARDCMGNVQGCILLSVTMLSCNDSQVARDAEELLENLTFLDQNVKQMARANYFKPMLQLLSSGTLQGHAI